MFRTIDRAVKSQSDEPKDNVLKILGPLAKDIQMRITSAEKKIEDIDSAYEKLANYYGDDPKKTPSEEFFSKVDGIWISYRKV